MATFTENYGLRKPADTDYYNIAELNENMDTLDEALAEAAAEREALAGRLGALEAGGGSIIRSIQRRDFTLKATGDSKTAALNPIDPEKCIVLLERLSDPTGLETKVIYTLGTESVQVVSGNGSNVVNLSVRLQIIEFF